MRDLTVCIPVHNEEPESVIRFYCELKMLGCEVIVIDDGNTMDFPDEINTITYPAHMGYGYAIKQGIKAVETPLICTADGDLQHTVSDVQKLYTVYKLIDDCKMVVGQRWNLHEKPIRWIGRKILNFIASCISGHYLSDLNSGLRIFDAKMAKGYLPILCDTFSFTTSLTMSVVTDGHKIAYLPINVKPRVYGKSHVRLVSDGLITLWYILWIGLALRTRRLRNWIRNNPITRVLLGIGFIIYGIIGIFVPGIPGDALCLTGLICISPHLADWCVLFYNKHPKLVWLYAIISTILGIFVLPYIGFKWIRKFINGR